jgi:DNA-binding NtrC family response regulator
MLPVVMSAFPLAETRCVTTSMDFQRPVHLMPNAARTPADVEPAPADIHAAAAPLTGAVASPLPFPAPMQEIVRQAARATVELCGGNKSEAARRLRISRTRLIRILSARPAPANSSPATRTESDQLPSAS